MLYQVCESKNVRELQETINLLIQKGWRPQGGLSTAVSQSTAQWWYYQAMVLDRGNGEFERRHEPELA
jgi:hypothetical protein